MAFLLVSLSGGLTAQIWGGDAPAKVDTIVTNDFERLDPVMNRGVWMRPGKRNIKF